MTFEFTLRDTKGKNLVQGDITGAVCVGRDGNNLNQVIAEPKQFADGRAGLMTLRVHTSLASDLQVRSRVHSEAPSYSVAARRITYITGQWTALDQSFITEESNKNKETVAS